MSKRALVLGGGGPVGIAWECGLLTGLAEAGVDLSEADFIVGTSAGSFVGAQIAMGQDIKALAAPFLAMKDPPPKPAGEAKPASPTRQAGPPPDLSFLFKKMAEAASGQRPAEEVRAELGAWAAEASKMSEDAFVQSFGRFLAGLPDDAWPTKGYACTAVDIETGAFHPWRREDGVGLARAVASSCSVPGVYPPITLKGRRYMDGGMRSPVNADVATGYDTVVVVALNVAAGSEKAAARAKAQLDGELQVLRDGGARVALVLPDTAAQAAFGPNLMDARKRPGAAQAGLDQARVAADVLRAVWAG
jgi:NTE family protein